MLVWRTMPEGVGELGHASKTAALRKGCFLERGNVCRRIVNRHTNVLCTAVKGYFTERNTISRSPFLEITGALQAPPIVTSKALRFESSGASQGTPELETILENKDTPEKHVLEEHHTWLNSKARIVSVSSANEVPPPVLSQDVAHYLTQKGITPQLLADVALPESLGVIQERMEFLESLGLNAAEAICSFPPLLGCSVARNFIPVLSFLETLGVSKSQLPALVKGYPKMLHSSVVVDLEPRLDFLLGLGIAKEDMARVLVSYPQLLGLQLEGTMSTTAAYLVGIGVSTRGIGPMVTQFPQILGLKVGTDILLKVTFLQEMGLTRQQTAALVEKHPFLLTLDLESQMEPASAAFCALAEIQRPQLGQVVSNFPQILGLQIEPLWATLSQWLVNTVGIPDADVAQIIASMPKLLVVNVEKAEEKLEYLLSWGFSRSQLASLVADCPQILGLHIGKALGPKLNHFLGKSGRTLGEVVEYPKCLLYSLEQIERREEKMQAVGVTRSLLWVLGCSDSDFELRLQAEIRSTGDT